MLESVQAEQAARAAIRIVGQVGAAVKQSGDHAEFVDREPGAAGAQVLAADHQRLLAEHRRCCGGARQVLVAIGGDHHGELWKNSQINCQRTHCLHRRSPNRTAVIVNWQHWGARARGGVKRRLRLNLAAFDRIAGWKITGTAGAAKWQSWARGLSAAPWRWRWASVGYTLSSLTSTCRDGSAPASATQAAYVPHGGSRSISRCAVRQSSITKKSPPKSGFARRATCGFTTSRPGPARWTIWRYSASRAMRLRN